jgi:hypothetical protein
MPLVHWQQTVSCAVLLLVRFNSSILSTLRLIWLQTEINPIQIQQNLPSLTNSSPAVFPLFGVQMYNKLGYQWATSVLAFLTVAMMPFPYLFFKYGKQIRAKSRFAKPK